MNEPEKNVNERNYYYKAQARETFGYVAYMIRRRNIEMLGNVALSVTAQNNIRYIVFDKIF